MSYCFDRRDLPYICECIWKLDSNQYIYNFNENSLRQWFPCYQCNGSGGQPHSMGGVTGCGVCYMSRGFNLGNYVAWLNRFSNKCKNCEHCNKKES